MKPTFDPKKTSCAELRTPVSFFMYQPSDGPDPGESEVKILFECFAEVYNASKKDLEILNSMETKQSATIRIRETHGEFYPDNKHYVELHDYRYKGVRFNIVDVRPDLTNNDFITVLLAVIK